MAMTGSDVYKAIAAELDMLRREYSVERIGLFGSYASGDQKEDSDVDLLVDFGQPVGLFRFVNLRDYLSERLGTRVDLATPSALKPDFRQHVLETVQYVGD